jgi:hypothetical protein
VEREAKGALEAVKLCRVAGLHRSDNDREAGDSTSAMHDVPAAPTLSQGTLRSCAEVESSNHPDDVNVQDSLMPSRPDSRLLPRGVTMSANLFPPASSSAAGRTRSVFNSVPQPLAGRSATSAVNRPWRSFALAGPEASELPYN